VPYDLKTLSFDAGDLKTPDFPGPEPAPPGAGAVVDGFALYAIVDHVEDRRIFRDLRQRAVQRRLSRGADQCEADERITSWVSLSLRMFDFGMMPSVAVHGGTCRHHRDPAIRLSAASRHSPSHSAHAGAAAAILDRDFGLAQEPAPDEH